jgi:hypothetical protein
MLNVLLGGLLAILGGLIGMWLQAKYARKIKMDQIIAEKKISANAEAYKCMKVIESMLSQAALEDTLKKIYKYEEWFFSTRLFLPGRFPDKWLSIRNQLSKAVRLEKSLESDTTEKSAEKLTALETKLSKLAEEAIVEIYNDMDIPRIKLES